MGSPGDRDGPGVLVDVCISGSRDARSVRDPGAARPRSDRLPEGTWTRDPDLWPMRGKTGAVRLALAGGIPVIPMAYWGAQEVLPR